jgi:hypothetical protein
MQFRDVESKIKAHKNAERFFVALAVVVKACIVGARQMTVCTYPEFMVGLMNAPHDPEKCVDCGGTGYTPIMCCSGISGGVVDCGCRGLPTDFEHCKNGCEQMPEARIHEYAHSEP